MNQLLRHATFAVGVAVIAWVGAGYVLTNPLALVVTVLIGAFWLMGVLELQRFRKATRELALAKLAELDTVMEQVIGAQERVLLSTVAARLEPRFDQLRGSRDAPASDTPAQPGPWLDRFCQEMRGLLLAELDLRLQPVEGLLEACRKSSIDRP